MKNRFIFIYFLIFLPIFSFAETQRKYERFYHAMDAQGMAGLNEEFSKEGIPWPRITTDSKAKKEGIPAEEQEEAVVLGRRLLEELKKESKIEPSDKTEILEKDAALYFSLGEKLWKYKGYRNQALALGCIDIGVQRCSQMGIRTKGQNTGPKLPESFSQHTIAKYLELYTSLIPESERHSGAGLAEKIKANPPKADNWLMVGIEIFKLAPEIMERDEESKHYDHLRLMGESSMAGMDTIFDTENIAAIVTRYAYARTRREGTLESLACYLRKGGSLDELIERQAFIDPFGKVMQKDEYKYTFMPYMSETPGPGNDAADAEIALDQKKFSERLFDKP